MFDGTGNFKISGAAGYLNVGYRFTNKIVGGIGGSYGYQKFNNAQIATGVFASYSQRDVGSRVFGQYFVRPNWYLWGEIEYTKSTFSVGRNSASVDFTSPFIGVGTLYNTSDKNPYLGFNGLLLFNPSYENPNSPYYQSFLITRIGFSF